MRGVCVCVWGGGGGGGGRGFSSPWGLTKSTKHYTSICDILDDITNEDTITAVQGKVSELCARLPVYA